MAPKISCWWQVRIRSLMVNRYYLTSSSVRRRVDGVGNEIWVLPSLVVLFISKECTNRGISVVRKAGLMSIHCLYA